MNLFETLSDMSSGYANSLDSGQYEFEKLPEPEPEPAPTLSLYNLLDHSTGDLEYLLNCVRRRITELEPNKLIMANTYASLCAWAALFKAAIRERQDRDSEAWATQTAKEINETI